MNESCLFATWYGKLRVSPGESARSQNISLPTTVQPNAKQYKVHVVPVEPTKKGEGNNNPYQYYYDLYYVTGSTYRKRIATSSTLGGNGGHPHSNSNVNNACVR